jgi:hypothetical protein
MSFAFSIIVCAGLVTAVLHYFGRMIGEQEGSRRWLGNWLWKGLGVPVFVWFVWNLGMLPGLPPIIAQIGKIQPSSPGWVSAFFGYTAAALFVISSYWAAVTLAWLLYAVAGREEVRRDVIEAATLWSLVLGPLALLFVYLSGWGGAGISAVLWLLPIAHTSLPFLSKKKIGPLYSRAIGKMKLGKYEDAEWEVLQELEKCEDDFEGWMMLADLYANHFDDLAGAQRTVHEICRHPDVTPTQISISLHRLADWQLKIGADPVAARRSLEEICERLPDTHLAMMARQRINQLPASREDLREQRKGRTIRLPALNDKLEETGAPVESEESQEQTIAQANRWVERLKQDPDNTSAREELARLFAERLNRAELGIEQIELLLEMPNQPAQKTAEWLGLVAAWQLKYLREPELARKSLQRLIREFPQSVQAFAAQRHLNLINMEERMRAVAGKSKVQRPMSKV